MSEEASTSRIERVLTGGSCVFKSPVFKFVVEGVAYYAHMSLIDRTSKPLDRLVHTEMLEKSRGYAVLTGVDAATFERFLQWLYCGFYIVPQPTIEKVTRQSTRQGTNTCGTQDQAMCVQVGRVESKKLKPCKVIKKDTKCKSVKTKDARLREGFIQKMTRIRQTSIAIPQPKPNIHETLDYTGIFIAHAQLYVFADEKDVAELKILAIEELHAVLSVFTLHKNRIGDIIALIAYAYENTYTTGDPLRNLLGEYMAMEADVLMVDDGFKALMFEDGGPIYDDFMSSLRKRME